MHRLHTGMAGTLAGLLFALSPPAALGVDVEGASFAPSVAVGDQDYQLIGHGLFRYMLWDAYAGAYYQTRGYPRPAPQETSVPRRLVLEYFHDIAADDFAEVTRDTLRDQLDDTTFADLQGALADFNASYRSVTPGDRYILTWSGERLTLELNGDALYSRDEPQLANALFGIWLGNAPLGEDFRDALLGR